MKHLLIILFISASCYSQDSSVFIKNYDSLLRSGQATMSFGSIPDDSIKVKILKIKGNSVWMKTLERPRVKLFTFCKPPFKEKDIVWIKKPS